MPYNFSIYKLKMPMFCLNVREFVLKYEVKYTSMAYLSLIRIKVHHCPTLFLSELSPLILFWLVSFTDKGGVGLLLEDLADLADCFLCFLLDSSACFLASSSIIARFLCSSRWRCLSRSRSSASCRAFSSAC